MGKHRKLKALEERLSAAQQAYLEVVREATKLRYLCACLLRRLTEDDAAVIPLELRREAMEGDWAVETEILEDELRPMVVRLRRLGAEAAARRMDP